MDPTLILQCRAPGLFIAKMIFLEMFSALRKSGLLRHVTSRHVTSRHVTSRHVTFCDSQFIQQQEDTQWVLRTMMGEFHCEIDQKVPIFVENSKKMQPPKTTFRSQLEPSIKSYECFMFLLNFRLEITLD